MVYYVKPRERKTEFTILDFIANKDLEQVLANETRTTTRAPSESEYTDIAGLISDLKAFNAQTEMLRAVNRSELYDHFFLLKKSGHGLRPIDAPKPELRNAHDNLLYILTSRIGDYFHHTCAFAYIKGRCNVDAVSVHQKADSKWFAKFDFHNFFGSTTLDFVMRMCSMIYPLNVVMEDAEGREELTKAMELCFLNGGLPQGTTMSPFLTNIMMIPIDHALLAYCYKNKMIYTRFADDIQISSKYTFDVRKVENRINAVLAEFGAPFLINKEKTHYGSRSGRNWILGVMLNGQNEITVGWKNKEYLKAMLTNFTLCTRDGTPWERGAVEQFMGKISYYRMVEKDRIDEIINACNKKYNVDVMDLMKKQING